MKRWALLAGVLVAAAPRGAHAIADYVGARPQGMGGAMRAAATGDAGPLLNPSGMSIVRSYALEGAYQLDAQNSTHFAHASVVDSTSDFNIAGGLYYTYVRSVTDDMTPKREGHEGALAMSIPVGDKIYFGATGKYLRLVDPADGNDGGITFDVGITARVADKANLGIVGYNLHDLKTRELPIAIGYGIAVVPTLETVLVLDGVTDFTTWDPNRGVRTSVMAGGEYLYAKKAAFRAGGGWAGVSENAYLSGGLSLISEVGAIDVGFRQDVSGAAKQTYLAAGLRLFVSTK